MVLGVDRVLLFLSSVKLVCEIALMSLLGRGVLYLLAGPRRDSNFFYQLLTVLVRPFTAVVRRITPRQVADHHVPLVAFFLLSIVWAIVTFERIRYCVAVNMVGCQ
jgi:uncharacterized protein YggT (Ycf19 family)